MPKSKKPRHPQRKVKHYTPLCLPKEATDRLQAMPTKYGLIAEMKLPAGTMTTDDVNCLRDVINHAITDFMLLNDYTEDRRETLMAGGMALRSLKKRGLRLGARYVATGDELNAIRDAIEVAGKRLDDGFKERPNMMMDEFRAMKDITTSPTEATVRVTSREIKKRMQRLVGQPWR